MADQEPSQELLELARETKAQFQATAKKVQDLIIELNAKLDDHRNRTSLDPVTVYEIKELQDDKALLKARLIGLIHRLTDPEPNRLEPEFAKIRNETENLRETTLSLSADLDAPFSRQDRLNSSAKINLKTIKLYYLPMNPWAEEHCSNNNTSTTAVEANLWKNYGWLRVNDTESDFVDEDDYDDTVPPEVKLRAVARKRKRETERARRTGNKRSLLECVVIDRTIGGGYTKAITAQEKATRIGSNLSRHAAELLYVAAATPWSRRRFKLGLRSPLEWLDQGPGATPAIARVRSVIETAAEHLGPPAPTSSPSQPGWDIEPEPGRKREFGKTVGAILRETLRLESVVSFPSVSREFVSTGIDELDTFDRALDECRAAVDWVGAQVEFMKAMHVFVSTNGTDAEAEALEAFANEVARIVETDWGIELDRHYVPT